MKSIWVGENSKIPNIHEAIARMWWKRCAISMYPVIRWPGGCFADIFTTGATASARAPSGRCASIPIGAG